MNLRLAVKPLDYLFVGYHRDLREQVILQLMATEPDEEILRMVIQSPLYMSLGFELNWKLSNQLTDKIPEQG